MDIQRHALDNWKTCRYTLSAAIESYLNACADLHTACSQGQHALGTTRTVEPVLLAIGAELDSLASEEAELSKARLSLSVARNSSSVLALVHTLPPEILARIVLIAQYPDSCSGYTNDLVPIHTFAQVSSYWRATIISLPHLWAHIHITPAQRNYRYATLLLNRSMGLPIRLDISNEDVTRSLSGYRAQAKWDKFMTRAIRRVHSLNIINSLPSPKTLLCDTLRVLLEHDSPRITKVLRIQRLFAGEFADPSLEILLAASQSSGILGSITVLHLSNILLPWTSAAYHNLTDIRLEFTASEGAEISTSQLGGILAASLELVVLKLEFIRIRQSIHWDTDDIVRPVHLEVLYLGYMDYESWVALLSVLSLSDCLGALEVCFGPALERISHPVRDFLRGVHVKTLAAFSLGSGSSPQWVLSLSTTIPSLKSLILSDYNPDTNGLEAATSGDSEASIDNTPCLPHLFLVTSDNLYLEELKLIVSAYGVGTLHLDGLRRYRRIPNVKRPEDLQAALLQLFPNLTCILSDEDTTRHWPCRTTFDQDGATT